MKKIMVVAGICLFILSAGVVLAESTKKESQPAPVMNTETKVNWQDKILDKMTADLGLTPAQRDKVAVIISESEAQGKALMDKMREEMKALRVASEQKLKAVLTKEQIQKYDQLAQGPQLKMDEVKGKGGKVPEEKPKGK
ncbi:MAG: Spy/CpxP family protein refolding chaperone [bacterium]|nr:Spy/CpxP family protein refolding chaperone [bacterium]